MTQSPTMIAAPTLHQVSAGPTTPGANGDPLVFIHALGADLQVWENVATAFVARHRVVRYDLRGHGRSESGGPESAIADHVDDLVRLLDRFAISSATLVGISVGGLIALAAALRHPSRVRGIVICASAARIGTRESWNERMALVRARGLEAMADTIMGRWVTPEFVAREPAAVRDLRDRLIRTPVDGYLATCAALRDADLREEAKAARVPALVLGGEYDVAVPAALCRELANTIPGAQWQLIPECAHLPPVEQPMLVSAAIARFISERP